jgi:hypothetical protein
VRPQHFATKCIIFIENQGLFSKNKPGFYFHEQDTVKQKTFDNPSTRRYSVRIGDMKIDSIFR